MNDALVVPITLPFQQILFRRDRDILGHDTQRIKITIPPACCNEIILPNHIFAAEFLAKLK